MSEEGRTDRFWNAGRLPAIFRPIEGEPTIIASRSKQSADGGQDDFFNGPLMGQRLECHRSPGRGERHWFKNPRGPRLRVQRFVMSSLLRHVG